MKISVYPKLMHIIPNIPDLLLHQSEIIFFYLMFKKDLAIIVLCKKIGKLRNGESIRCDMCCCFTVVYVTSIEPEQ